VLELLLSLLNCWSTNWWGL